MKRVWALAADARPRAARNFMMLVGSISLTTGAKSVK